MRKILCYLCIPLMLLACDGSHDVRMLDVLPPIYPDYIDVTIPENVAPLNFLIRADADKMMASITGSNASLVVKGKSKIIIPEKKWRQLLGLSREDSLKVVVTARIDGVWVQYEPFYWHVKADGIDPWLSYRLIEPGYEVWNKIQIVERHVESFNERVIADNNLVDGSCMNCHIYGNNDASLSMFHIRGKQGGTILNRDGKLRKMNTRTDEMIGNAVYGNFHPSGRYGVFSTNVVIPEFHAYRSERLEVYDSASDLVVLDFDKNEVITRPFLSDSLAYETFPVFSACGKWIYYCVAPGLPLPDSLRSLKYSLCRISFDAETGIVGTHVDTLWSAQKNSGSVSHLKTSPDGRYLLYTVADYGTFPIWHREANLQMMDLKSGAVDSLKRVNGRNSDSYHSWSSNSRWFVFASKRDDGIYGKPYFCYVDSSGKAHKPFVLPQQDPEVYDNTLKSFNIPELSKAQVSFDAMDIEHIYHQKSSESMTTVVMDHHDVSP